MIFVLVRSPLLFNMAAEELSGRETKRDSEVKKRHHTHPRLSLGALANYTCHDVDLVTPALQPFSLGNTRLGLRAKGSWQSTT